MKWFEGKNKLRFYWVMFIGFLLLSAWRFYDYFIDARDRTDLILGCVTGLMAVFYLVDIVLYYRAQLKLTEHKKP